jgi:hypothetical protein
MRETWLTAGIIAALVLSVVALWLGTQGLRIPGKPTIVASGKWCCNTCSGGGSTPLKCSGCVPTTLASCKLNTATMVLVDCSGNTTEVGGEVTCY